MHYELLGIISSVLKMSLRKLIRYRIKNVQQSHMLSSVHEFHKPFVITGTIFNFKFLRPKYYNSFFLYKDKLFTCNSDPGNNGPTLYDHHISFSFGIRNVTFLNFVINIQFS
jgi:hypothetical protein